MEYKIVRTPEDVRANRKFNYCYDDREYWSVYFLEDTFRLGFSALHGFRSREQVEEVAESLTYYL